MLLGAAVVVACIAAALSIVWFTWRTGIAPMPTTPRACRAMLAATQDAPAGDVVDLGSGWGTLAIAFARQHPQRRVIGYEMSWLPWAASVTLARALRLRNLSFRRADFLHADLSQAGVLLCFLFPRGMQAVAQRLRHGDCPRALVVSNTFALPGFAPAAVVSLDDLYRTKVYVYRPVAPA